MIGTGLWNHFAEDRTAERGRLLHKAMAERETLRGETLSRTGRHVSYVMFPLGDGLGVFVRDVTDRRTAEKQREEAEEALRKRTAELEAVLETIPTAVWFTTDHELRQVVGNRRTIELLRIPRELDLSSALTSRAASPCSAMASRSGRKPGLCIARRRARPCPNRSWRSASTTVIGRCC
jgi:PAS domain-containing protein